MFDSLSFLKNLGIRDAIVLDTEYSSPTHAEHVLPVCLCAQSLFTKQTWKVMAEPGQSNPLPVGDDILYVCFSAHAEWGYYLAMGWELPALIVDLYAERMMATRAERDRDDSMVYPSLLSSLIAYKLNAMDAVRKEGMRTYAQERDSRQSAENDVLLLDYCLDDATSTGSLFLTMFSEAAEQVANRIMNVGRPGDDETTGPSCAQELFDIEMRREFVFWKSRGDYTRVIAWWQYNGIPTDVAAYERIIKYRKPLMNKLIAAVEGEHHYGCYVQKNKKNKDWSFSKAGFDALVVSQGLEDVWLRTDKGKNYSAADDKVLKPMSETYPFFRPLRDLVKFVTVIRKFELFIGKDGRSRVFPDPWHTDTSRNNPSNNTFLFTLPKWARPLMKPGPGRALVYSDMIACEVGIAGAISGDEAFTKTYNDSLKPGGVDVYVGFAKLAGAIPEDGTKKSHPEERDQYKSGLLGNNYGQTPEGLAKKKNLSYRVAKYVCDKHREVYWRWWQWIENQICEASVRGYMSTKWGWRRTVTEEDVEEHYNALLNFPIQSSGAEIMRLASVYMLDEGLLVCANVHDAAVIDCAIEDVKEVEAICAVCWKRASAAYIEGFEVGADAKVVCYPDAWLVEDKEDLDLWYKIQKLLDEIEAEPPELPAQVSLELIGG
jgi:DNA polymerase-1